jgi:hypothetical protein
VDATRVRIQARGMNGELYLTTSIDLHYAVKLHVVCMVLLDVARATWGKRECVAYEYNTKCDSCMIAGPE